MTLVNTEVFPALDHHGWNLCGRDNLGEIICSALICRFFFNFINALKECAAMFMVMTEGTGYDMNHSKSTVFF